jgi:hypothetical protein
MASVPKWFVCPTLPPSIESQKQIWLILKIFIGGIIPMTSSQGCKKCILPAEYPGISIDDTGVCNYCRNWEEKWHQINYEKQFTLLKEIFDSYREKSKPYDCLLGLSGGKDSCYAAYVLKENNMNPLACTFDNGFMTEQALNNIRNTVKLLSIDHVFIQNNSDYLNNYYKHFVRTTGEFCSVCNVGIRAALYRTAKSNGINLIVSGSSPRTEANSPKEYFSCSSGYFHNVTKDAFSKKEVGNYLYITQLQRAISHLRHSPFYLQLPNYVPWEEEDFIPLLEEKLNWNGNLGEQHNDCQMSDAKEYLKMKQFGVIELTAKLSCLIRDKQISREKALSLSQKHMDHLIKNEAAIREQIKKQFDLSEDDLERITHSTHVKYLSKGDDALSKVKNIYEKFKYRKSE